MFERLLDILFRPNIVTIKKFRHQISLETTFGNDCDVLSTLTYRKLLLHFELDQWYFKSNVNSALVIFDGLCQLFDISNSDLDLWNQITASIIRQSRQTANICSKRLSKTHPKHYFKQWGNRVENYVFEKLSIEIID